MPIRRKSQTEGQRSLGSFRVVPELIIDLSPCYVLEDAIDPTMMSAMDLVNFHCPVSLGHVSLPVTFTSDNISGTKPDDVILRQLQVEHPIYWAATIPLVVRSVMGKWITVSPSIRMALIIHITFCTISRQFASLHADGSVQMWTYSPVDDEQTTLIPIRKVPFVCSKTCIMPGTYSKSSIFLHASMSIVSICTGDCYITYGFDSTSGTCIFTQTQASLTGPTGVILNISAFNSHMVCIEAKGSPPTYAVWCINWRTAIWNLITPNRLESIPHSLMFAKEDVTTRPKLFWIADDGTDVWKSYHSNRLE